MVAISLDETLEQTIRNERGRLEALLPPRLDQIARETGALVRRRVVRSAADLLRIALLYSLHSHSLRTTAAIDGLEMSDVAVLGRLRKMPPFLREILATMMDVPATLHLDLQRPIVLVDSSVLNSPGATTGDWRLHSAFDAVALSAFDFHLSSARIAESLAHHDHAAGTLLIGDRGYAKATQIQLASENQWLVLLRVSPQILTITDTEGHEIDAWELMREADATPTGIERVVRIPIKSGPAKGSSITGRLLVTPLPAEKAEAARKKVLRQANKKSKRVRRLTTALAGYVLLFSTVDSDELNASQLHDLYRLRWQIECYFKHLKSDLGINEIRAHDPDLVHCFVLSKLLIGCLIDRLRPADFSPSG